MKYLDEIKKIIRKSNLKVEGSSNIEIDKTEKELKKEEYERMPRMS